MSGCRWCKSSRRSVVTGTGPHAAAVVCGDCGKHIKWLPAVEAPDPETLKRNAAEVEARREAERMPLFRGGDR